MSLFHNPANPSDPLPIFLLQAFVVLLVTRVVGRLLKFIHQPQVIGEIIGGIICGPSCLGKIPAWKNNVFPDFSLGQFQLLANVGLILFMFFLGLELDFVLMKRQVKVAAPIALSAIFCPFIIGAVFSLYVYQEYSPPSVNRVAFVLFFGAAMSFTAFPVLAALLQSAGLLADPIGILGFSCAAIDDVVAWSVLTFAISFSSDANNPLNGLYTLLLALAFVIVMFGIVRPMLAALTNFVNTHEDNKPLEDEVPHTPQSVTGHGKPHLHRIEVLVVFLVLLASSFYTESIGIHAFFGAFLAGIVVPKQGDVAHLLAPKIELVVVDFLLPLYFANSGLRLNLSSIRSHSFGVLFAILGLACLGKFLPTLIVSKLLTRQSWRFCASLGILMNTRGLVELIVLNIGLDLHILSTELFTMMVVMAVVTTVITPPLFFLVYTRPLLQQKKAGTGAAESDTTTSDSDESDGSDGPIQAGRSAGAISTAGVQGALDENTLVFSSSIGQAVRISERVHSHQQGIGSRLDGMPDTDDVQNRSQTCADSCSEV